MWQGDATITGISLEHLCASCIPDFNCADPWHWRKLGCSVSVASPTTLYYRYSAHVYWLLFTSLNGLWLALLLDVWTNSAGQPSMKALNRITVTRLCQSSFVRKEGHLSWFKSQEPVHRFGWRWNSIDLLRIFPETSVGFVSWQGVSGLWDSRYIVCCERNRSLQQYFDLTNNTEDCVCFFLDRLHLHLDN